MPLTADATDGKTGYRSSADVCRRRQYFWWQRKCLCLHMSYLRWRASIATATTVSCHSCIIKQTTYICQLLCYVVSCRMLFFVMCRHRTLRTNTLNYCVWHWWIRQLELLGLLRSEHYLWGWLWSKLCLQCLEQIGTRQVTLQVVGLLNLIKWI